MEVGPLIFMQGPDMSFSTPIFTVGAPCARRCMIGMPAAPVAIARSARRDMVMTDNPSSGVGYSREGGDAGLGRLLRKDGEVGRSGGTNIIHQDTHAVCPCWPRAGGSGSCRSPDHVPSRSAGPPQSARTENSAPPA